MVQGKEVVLWQHLVWQDYTCYHMLKSLQVCYECPLCFEQVTVAIEEVCKRPEKVTLICEMN